MSSVNKAIIIGNLGKDHDIRNTQDGKTVTSFTIATSEEWKDKNTGEKKSKTEWHRIVSFGKLAEICGEYLVKGKQVYVEGRIQTRSWEKDGVTRYTTEIVADQMRMLGSRGDSHDTGGNQSPQSAPAQSPPEDDIPF